VIPDLVDRITRDRPRVETVPSCISYTARIATRPGQPRAIDTITGGAALGDHDRARAAALGEAVERHCGNAVPHTLPTAPYSRLKRRGAPAVDPRDFALYSPSQYMHRGFPFVEPDPDLEIAWATGTDLADQSQTLVPASLTWVNYHRGPHAHEPHLNYPLLAGTAAGRSPEDARRAALEEVFERDAVTLWWMSGAPAALLTPAPAGRVSSAIAEARNAGLQVTLLHIPSTFAVTVAGAFIEDPARRLVAFGSACRATTEAAAAKALTEAIGMHETGLELLDHDSPFWTAVRAGHTGHRPYRPHRKDRTYRTGFRPDLRDVNDVRLHLQLHLDPITQGARLDRLRNPSAPPPPEPHPGGAGLAHGLHQLGAQGLKAIAVDLTTPGIRAGGLHVARVLVPGLTCNAPAAFPFLGGHRLRREPPARGWVPDPLTEKDLVLDPLPFS
jgi:ribosomal protein S12 methylthiotransferase accessory factor